MRRTGFGHPAVHQFSGEREIQLPNVGVEPAEDLSRRLGSQPGPSGRGIRRSGRPGQLVRRGHPRERIRDGSIPASRSVLIAEGGLGRRVPDPGHQLSQCRASLRGENRAGVTKIMDAKVRTSDLLPRWVPTTIDRVGVHLDVGVLHRREDERIAIWSDVRPHVVREHRSKMWWHGHSPDTRVALGCPDGHLTLDSDHTSGDMQEASRNVDVAPAQLS